LLANGVGGFAVWYTALGNGVSGFVNGLAEVTNRLLSLAIWFMGFATCFAGLVN